MTELIKNLIKGAASLTLFHGTADIDELRKNFPQPKSTEDAWKEDWSKIGSDFERAVSRVTRKK